LRLDTINLGDRFIVAVKGDLDAATATQLSAVLDTLAEDTSTIVLDFSELRFMDSTGIGVIAGAIRTLERVDGRLEIRSAPDPVLRVLTITNLLPYIHLVKSGNGTESA